MLKLLGFKSSEALSTSNKIVESDMSEFEETQYQFSDFSKRNLEECVRELQEIAHEAIDVMDFTVVCGARSKEEQQRKYAKGLSQVQWPNSKHNVTENKTKSRAFDLAPYPIDWQDEERFYILAGVILTIARQRGVDIRWGGDWDSDLDVHDQSFNDLGHFEV